MQVKVRLALEKIAVLENLEATEEEIEAEYTRIAEAYNIDVAEVKKSIESSAIAEDMKVKKAMDLVKEKAAVTVKKKRATTKKTTTKTTTKKTKKETEETTAEEPAKDAE